jgi:branched-chain amino acid transport system permease protein
VWSKLSCARFKSDKPSPSQRFAPGPSLSRSAGEGLTANTAQPLSRTAGEGAERSEAGEGAAAMSTVKFWGVSFLVAGAFLVLTRLIPNDYFFFAGYQVLQFIVLATAWNILGGYTGYTNFGTGAFFAVGAYSAVVLHKLTAVPVPVMMLAGGVVSGIIGLGMGYLTLRLRGVFFAIATLAMAIVAQTLIVNWDYVGGSRGIYIIRPQQAPIHGNYVEYLYSLMLILTWISVAVARTIERSRLGLGFNAIRDDELAAEAGGVPTLRLKLIATTLSGALMGMSGAPLPYYVTYLDPASSFNLSYAVNSVAMPLIGGTTSWIGPVIGAVLLGTIQQLATVTISSALNLLIVGLLLIGFVIIAPNGVVGLFNPRRRARRR